MHLTGFEDQAPHRGHRSSGKLSNSKLFVRQAPVQNDPRVTHATSKSDFVEIFENLDEHIAPAAKVIAKFGDGQVLFVLRESEGRLCKIIQQ